MPVLITLGKDDPRGPEGSKIWVDEPVAGDAAERTPTAVADPAPHPAKKTAAKR